MEYSIIWSPNHLEWFDVYIDKNHDMTYDTIFSDFLTQLGVPHTRCWSNRQFCSMPFQSLFGLKKLMQTYGVESEGWMVDDKTVLPQLPVPFIAGIEGGYVIVTSTGPDGVEYISDGERLMMPCSEFMQAWSGVILSAHPDENSSEPDYKMHRIEELAQEAKRYAMWGGVFFLIAYLFVVNGLWRMPWSWGVMLVDIAGLVLTYMLLQKTLKIKNRAADRVCGVLQKEGCDHVLELKASKFFGLFSWSEVGFTYFSVSFIALLTCPTLLPTLAAINICCLPFTCWSIWYQKFRARHWCTLCVSVQGCLWLLFICYLCGGWVALAWPLTANFFALGISYLVVLLALNRIMPRFDKSSEQ